MAVEAERSRVTSLFSNDVLARVERLRMNTSRRFTNRSSGEHLAGRAGSSNEFADYRNYVVGDDLRYVDWNVFARLRRPYVKLYHHEEQMHLVLLVDASSSMLFEGKLQRAKQLVAALSVMGLFNNERVSIHAFNQANSATSHSRPCRGRGSMRELFRFLEEIEGGGDELVEQGVRAMLKHHRGRGAVVVVSDFLTPGDLRRTMNMLYSRGLEVFGIQVLGPTEIDPEVSGDLRFVDSETNETLDVSGAGDLVGLYQQYRLGMERELEQLCRQRMGRYLMVNAQSPLETLLFDRMRRTGWVVG